MSPRLGRTPFRNRSFAAAQDDATVASCKFEEAAAATNQKKVQSGSLATQVDTLAKRVAAIEQQLASASDDARHPLTEARRVATDVPNQELATRRDEWNAREARRKAIAEFDAEEEREFWRPHQARLDAMKRA